MAAPDPLPPAEQFTYIDWKEAVASFRPAGPMSFSREGGEAPLVGTIDAARVRGCLRFLLGWDDVTDSGTRVLRRTNPVTHPDFPNLIANSVAVEFFKPYPADGNLKVPARLVGTGPSLAPSLKYRTNYKKCRVTVRFEPALWPLLDDSQIAPGEEWKRNVWVDQEPRAEILTLSGFQMKYTEGEGGAAGGVPYSTAKGQAYPSEIGQVLVKSDLQVTWKWVPETWIFRTGTARPTRILFRLGCVNYDPFFGYDPGTLRLDGCKLQRHPNTLKVPGSLEPDFTYTVTFMMNYFQPDKGYSVAGGTATRLTTANGFATEGHNALPFRGANPVDPPVRDGNAGLWFYATYDGLPFGRPQFYKVAFADLFDSAQNGT